ncbi:MutS2 family protein [Alkaliphilus metalliredigens QYMF]|uniref:Endonuclease MutS2 n=1 Tax=Alkaliphilus metalliredigens (strain QYMF) TaxID=293826 RepID=MUTS2_ALKMQ|nr:endonuclease MutS2 [Alkaliphilus metalliredigens]A6TNX0.1 RecName: Full=Endonuclease MutS2 [Alkaliphilus metalliredigens QYMF]ABR47888.1 MutS2 family protein [Alkaliphilus metalliredigens QYMF]
MNEKSIRVLEYGKMIDRLEERCLSAMAKEKARELRPIQSFGEITQLQSETSEAQSILIQRGNIPLGGIHDIKQYLRKTEIGSYLDPKELLLVKDTLRTARNLKSFFKEGDDQTKHPIVSGLIQGLQSFRAIEDRIEICIVSDTEISDHASSTLKNIRRQISSKNDAVRNKLNGIINSSTTQKYLQDAIITMRQDRYVVPVKQEHRGNVPGLIHDQSSSGATLFVEPMAVVQLNNELRELKIKEHIEIERILMEIAEMIAQYATEMRNNQIILTAIDFVFAKGKLSLEMKGVEPLLNVEGNVHIKNGRHPLLNADEVVPTNLWIGETFQTLVITGPNTGGKTVTLKTLGLLSMMAQSGLHVPADYGTRLAIFDQIFADIGDEQSIEQSLSTFSSHMTNIVNIVEEVTSNSLVLFDELGAGTDPTEGAALGMAILNHLREMNVTTVATTHYSELKQYALTNEGVENASVEFDVATLSPTYRLLIGVPGKSNAFEISKKLGLPDGLVQRAKRFLSQDTIHFEDLLQNIEKNRRESEIERQEAKRIRLEAEKFAEGYEDRKQRLEAQRDQILRDAKKEAYRLVKEAKMDSEHIIKGLREMKFELEAKEMNKKMEDAKNQLTGKMNDLSDHHQQILNKKNKKPPKNLKPGDAVRILSLNQVGHVLNEVDPKGEVQVQAGIMKVNMHISNLERVSPEKDIQQSGTGKIMKSKTGDTKSEVDVRGKNLEEAMLEIDKYLDDSYIVGLTQVTIIHGVGTGVLKAGIKQMLKKNKHVRTHREGVYGEGGMGVTIVELK